MARIRRNVSMPPEIDAKIQVFMKKAGMNYSQVCAKGAELLIEGKVFVPLVGELSVNTTPAEFEQFAQRAKGGE